MGIAGLREQRLTPSQPGDDLLELPAIEQLDCLSFRGWKVEVSRNRFRIGEKSVAQFIIQQRFTDQFCQTPARRGIGIQFAILLNLRLNRLPPLQ